MRLLLLLGLVGCDQVFGLDGRQDRDAAVGDVMTPADIAPDGDASACPASGPPAFTPVSAFLLTNCKNYTTSKIANRALVSCTSFYESALDTSDKMAAIVNIEPQEALYEPRLSPEGDEMFVTSQGPNGTQIRRYQRIGGQWHLGSALAGLPIDMAAPPTTLFASTPTAKSGSRRIMLAHLLGDVQSFEEWKEDADTWSLVTSYTPANLGVATFAYPSLTPDGLHLVFSANPVAAMPAEIRYAWRATIDDRFDTSVKIDVGVNDVLYPHLASDCHRLYFTALDTVQYVDAVP